MVVVPAVRTRPPPLDEVEDEAWSAAAAADDATRSSHAGDEHGIVPYVVVLVRAGDERMLRHCSL
jgi:hypothetical protein